MKKISLGILLLISLNISYAWSLFGPSNYEECILQNMKGTTSDVAAELIADACTDKFYSAPKVKKCKTREMTTKEIRNIDANGSISQLSTPYFSVNIYNGNPEITIEELTVIVMGANIASPQEYKLYISSPINPKTSGTAGVGVQNMPGKKFSWSIVSAKTCAK